MRPSLILALAMAILAFAAPVSPADVGRAVGASSSGRAGSDEAFAAGSRAQPTEPTADAARVARLPRGALLAVRRPLPIRNRPAGRIAVVVRPETEFGSPQVLGVAARRGRWLGVVTSDLRNGKLGWVERSRVRNGDGVRLGRTAYSLRADLSARTLELRRGGRRVRRLAVAVGAPGSPTPTGRFAVTDKLHGPRYGSYYGCCIIAISGHQPRPPAGWTGGSRLAIHGTDAPGTIGAAASAGCLRAADRGLERLMRAVPLGTPVFIRA